MQNLPASDFASQMQTRMAGSRLFLDQRDQMFQLTRASFH
jgi:hypothetical protein